MNNPLIKFAGFAAIGIIISVSSSAADSLLFVAAGILIAALAVYFYYQELAKKQYISTFEVDSIYYLGFLITIATLVANILLIALHKDIITKSPTQLVIQFGAGLFFTGFALFFRLLLLGKQGDDADDDFDKRAEQLGHKLAELSNKFDVLGNNIVTLANAAQTRSQTVIGAFASIENQFRNQLDKSAKLFEQHIQTTTAEIKQAETDIIAAKQRNEAREQQLEAGFNAAAIDFKKQLQAAYENAVKTNQAREQQLETTLTQATTQFRDNLAQSQRESLQKTQAAIDSSNQHYTDSIAKLIQQIDRIKTEAETINFKQTTVQLNQFAGTLKDTLTTLAHTIQSAGDNTLNATQTLTEAAQQAQTIASRIAEHLSELRQLETLIASIQLTGNGLNQLSQRAEQSSHSFAHLAQQTDKATVNSAYFSDKAQIASDTLEQLANHQKITTASIQELTEAIQQNRSVIQDLSVHLDRLHTLEKLAELIEKTGHRLTTMAERTAQSSDNLQHLSNGAQNAAKSTEALNQRLQQSVDSYRPVIDANYATAETSGKLVNSLRETQTTVADINAAWRQTLSTRQEPTPIPTKRATPTPIEKPKSWYKMTMTETWNALFKKKR